ncbi:UNVERIFIED_CONTAM: Lpcat3 [Trichonephila clavipes]
MIYLRRYHIWKLNKMWYYFIAKVFYVIFFSCSISTGFKSLGLGILILAMHQIGLIFIPEKTLLSEDYLEFPLWKKLLIMGVWGKMALYKYIAIWLIAEGSCILTGLTYNGTDENGNDLWDGCTNVKLWDFTTTTTFQGGIRSFNCNTNLWLGQYVYKRMKFLGNRYVSQAAALLFLATWHGLHSGYYVCFLNEFIVMYFEKDEHCHADSTIVHFVSSEVVCNEWSSSNDIKCLGNVHCSAPPTQV